MKSPRKYWPYPVILIFVVILSAGYLALAQEQESVSQTQDQPGDIQSSESITEQVKGLPGAASKSAVINVRELAAQRDLIPAPYREPKVIREPGPGPRNRTVPGNTAAPQESQAPEPFGESNAPAVASPGLLSTFKALDDNNASIPPDTNGAVGPNHLMVVHNTEIRFQTKAGANLSTLTLDSFWAALGNPSVFDPKVLYDPFNNRWIFVCVADGDTTTSSILIGVSQTSDPTATWKIFKVDADSTNKNWADYPSVGFNKNWIVVTVNIFKNSPLDGFVRADVYAFDKTKIYAANPTATFKRFPDAGGGFTMAPAVTYDNTLNPLYLVEDWDGHSQLRIGSINGTAAAPTYSATAAGHKFTPPVAGANTWSFEPPNGDDFAPQKGSTNKIQVNDSRILNAVYRNGSLWCAQTVFLPSGATSTRSAVQWWEVKPTTGAITQRGRIDDSTGQKFYGFPSIAVNKNSDVLIGYSRFWSQQFASAYYAFRAAGDAPNTLRTEALLKAGAAPYFKTFGGDRNRWGDYSNTQVDPVNDLDLWTIQEYAAAVSGGFSRWGTWWGRVGPSAPAALIGLGTVTAVDGNTGDPDTVIEPGENGNKLTIQLKNTGNGGATAVSGKLTTSTAGVTITSNMSAYPNLAARTGAGNNTTPFTFNVASTVPCGTALSFTLTVTYTGVGSPATLSFTVPTGKPGAAVTKAYAGAVRPIPDNNSAGVNITLAVSGLGTKISDLNFKIGGTNCSTPPTGVGLDHTWVGDIVMTLKSPQGTVVTLMNQPGGVNNNGQNFCNTTLDDEAAGGSIQSVTPAQAPYTGTFKPAGPLSAFDGQNPNGTWTLNVSDRGALDTGNMRAFSLIITPIACSTTALATPVEIRSDRALASLPSDGNSTVAPFATAMSFAPASQIFSSLGATASSTNSVAGTQQSGLTGEQYLVALFASRPTTPVQIEGELLRSALMADQYNDLLRLLARS